MLRTIYPGEGYWVFAEAETAITQVAYPLETLFGNWQLNGLPEEWNLLAAQESVTPQTMSGIVTQGPPSPSYMGTQSSSATSIWTWDSYRGKWYFYSFDFEQSCGANCLSSYAEERGFLDFNAYGKRLEQNQGFWLNYQRYPSGGRG